MTTSLKVRRIGYLKHKLDEFVSISLCFPSTNSRNCLAYAYIYHIFHLVKGLKVNLLVNNNIIATKSVIIDLTIRTAMISSCQIIIYVIARPRYYPVERKVLVHRSLIIYSESEILVQFVYSDFSNDQDFVFNPTPHSHFMLFCYIFNNPNYKMLVWNKSH